MLLSLQNYSDKRFFFAMKLFYRRFGEGFPVIILHGLFGLSDNWVTFGKALGKHYSVFIPDLRNHGQSPHHPVFNLDVMAQDIREFTTDNDLQEIILIGHSLGGKIAMQVALENPETVKKLVVVDVGLNIPPPDNDHQQLINAMISVDFSTTRSRSDVEKQLKDKIASLKLRQFLLKNVYWRDRETLGWRLDLHAINNNLPSVFMPVSVPGIYEGPVLFVRGGRSKYISDEDLPGIQKKFPRVILHTIADASHWVHADAPGEFYDVVSRFLLNTVQP